MGSYVGSYMGSYMGSMECAQTQANVIIDRGNRSRTSASKEGTCTCTHTSTDVHIHTERTLVHVINPSTTCNTHTTYSDNLLTRTHIIVHS